MKKGCWIAAGVSAALVGALAIGLGVAQAKSSDPGNAGGTKQTAATSEAMPASMPAQCQAMHDQMDQMTGGEMGSGMVGSGMMGSGMMGSGMMGSGSGMVDGATGSDMTGGSGDRAGASMASHHGSGSTNSGSTNS